MACSLANTMLNTLTALPYEEVLIQSDLLEDGKLPSVASFVSFFSFFFFAGRPGFERVDF